MNPICPLTLLSGVSGDSIQPCILAYLTRNYFYVAAAAVCQTASAVTQCVSQLIHVTTRGQNQLIIYLYGRIFFLYLQLHYLWTELPGPAPLTHTVLHMQPIMLQTIFEICFCMNITHIVAT